MVKKENNGKVRKKGIQIESEGASYETSGESISSTGNRAKDLRRNCVLHVQQIAKKSK